MKEKTSDSSVSIKEVRFSKFVSIIIILISHAPLVFAGQQIISLKQELFQGSNFVIPLIAILAGLLIIVIGMSHPKRWYIRLDRDNKMLMFSYGFGSWSMKHPYDSIYFVRGKFHIEKNREKKKIRFVKLACNKNDFKSMVATLAKPS